MSKRTIANLATLTTSILVASLAVVIAPSDAATPTPTPSPTTRTYTGGTSTNRATPTPTPRPTSTAGAPVTPQVTLLEPQVPAVFADTNVPQISSITTELFNKDGIFTVSFWLKLAIHRNTLQSIALEFKPKVKVGGLNDPIFQAPCTPLTGVSTKVLTTDGNLAALQNRSKSGDWYAEEYLLQLKTAVTSAKGPCPGDYVITKISLVDAADHTLDIDANLAITFPIATSKTPNPPKVTTTDTAIMQSNIWNVRPDLAPCVAGTNLLPTITTTTVGGRTIQNYVPATIVNTNRVACSPTVAFNIANAIFSINDSTYQFGNTSDALPKLVDYASLAAQTSAELAKLQTQYAALLAHNESLTAELSNGISIGVVQPGTKATPKATAKATAKAKATPKASSSASKKPTVKKPTKKATPKPTWTRGSRSGSSKWRGKSTATPAPSKK